MAAPSLDSDPMLLDYSSTPDRFTLTEHRTLAVVVGGALAAAGAIVLWFAVTQGARASDLVIGIPGTLLGLGIMVAWPRRLATFDRAAGTACLTTLAGPWTARMRTIPLDEIAGVVVQRARVRYNAQMFDPALVLRSGERVPLVFNATGFFGLEQRAANAAREWLGVRADAPLPPPPVRAGVVRARRVGGTIGRSIAAAVAVAGLAVAGMGALSEWLQARELRTSRATRALVIADSLDVWHDRAGAERVRPVVHYRYVVNGAAHESWRVWPVARRGSRAWADSLLARFPAGDSATAYASPRHPWRAYLDPTPTALPWGVLGFGAVVFLVGGLVFVSLRGGPRADGS